MEVSSPSKRLGEYARSKWELADKATYLQQLLYLHLYLQTYSATFIIAYRFAMTGGPRWHIICAFRGMLSLLLMLADLAENDPQLLGGSFPR